MSGEYWAITWWDGQQQWLVRVEDYDKVHRGDTTAPRLGQVAPNASTLLGAAFGCDPSLVHASVEVRLPEKIEYALRLAEGHVADAAREVDSVVAALRQANMPRHDIAALLAARALQAAPQRPLLVTNAEIAACGLSRRHDVIALEWEEGDAVLTCCRSCVEKNRRPWQTRPGGASAAVYDGPGRCDICGRDVVALAGGR